MCCIPYKWFWVCRLLKRNTVNLSVVCLLLIMWIFALGRIKAKLVPMLLPIQDRTKGPRGSPDKGIGHHHAQVDAQRNFDVWKCLRQAQWRQKLVQGQLCRFVQSLVSGCPQMQQTVSAQPLTCRYEETRFLAFSCIFSLLSDVSSEKNLYIVEYRHNIYACICFFQFSHLANRLLNVDHDQICLIFEHIPWAEVGFACSSFIRHFAFAYGLGPEPRQFSFLYSPWWT